MTKRDCGQDNAVSATSDLIYAEMLINIGSQYTLHVLTVVADTSTQICVSVSGCTSTASSSNNGFSMEFGGGPDIPIHEHIQIRPVEADFLLTHYGSNLGINGYSAYQKNFKYFGGINFTFGGSI